MPPAPNPTRSNNGGGPAHGNLFLEGDPDTVGSQAASPRPVSVRRAEAPTRGRGLVVPIEESAPTVAAAPQPRNAAAFTRTRASLGGLQGRARERAQRADTNARRVMVGLASRPYVALFALAMVAATLLALSWMGLALRNATTARHSANHRAAVATLAATRDQTRIAALTGQLERARAAQLRATDANRQLRTAAVTQPVTHRSAHANPRRR